MQRVPDRALATKKAVIRASKLFLLGLVLQGMILVVVGISLLRLLIRMMLNMYIFHAEETLKVTMT